MSSTTSSSTTSSCSRARTGSSPAPIFASTHRRVVDSREAEPAVVAYRGAASGGRHEKALLTTDGPGQYDFHVTEFPIEEALHAVLLSKGSRRFCSRSIPPTTGSGCASHPGSGGRRKRNDKLWSLRRRDLPADAHELGAGCAAIELPPLGNLLLANRECRE